ncbi:hypothetical protein GN956_G16045 [Arapaima gigas]
MRLFSSSPTFTHITALCSFLQKTRLPARPPGNHDTVGTHCSVPHTVIPRICIAVTRDHHHLPWKRE